MFFINFQVNHSLTSYFILSSGEVHKSAAAIPKLEDPFNDLKVADDDDATEVSTNQCQFIIIDQRRYEH